MGRRRNAPAPNGSGRLRPGARDAHPAASTPRGAEGGERVTCGHDRRRPGPVPPGRCGRRSLRTPGAAKHRDRGGDLAFTRHKRIELGACPTPTGRRALQHDEHGECQHERRPRPRGHARPVFQQAQQADEDCCGDPTLTADGAEAPPEPAWAEPGGSADDRSGAHTAIVAPPQARHRPGPVVLAATGSGPTVLPVFPASPVFPTSTGSGRPGSGPGHHTHRPYGPPTDTHQPPGPPATSTHRPPGPPAPTPTGRPVRQPTPTVRPVR